MEKALADKTKSWSTWEHRDDATGASCSKRPVKLVGLPEHLRFFEGATFQPQPFPVHAKTAYKVLYRGPGGQLSNQEFALWYSGTTKHWHITIADTMGNWEPAGTVLYCLANQDSMTPEGLTDWHAFRKETQQFDIASTVRCSPA